MGNLFTRCLFAACLGQSPIELTSLVKNYQFLILHPAAAASGTYITIWYSNGLFHRSTIKPYFRIKSSSRIQSSKMSSSRNIPSMAVDVMLFDARIEHCVFCIVLLVESAGVGRLGSSG